MADIEYLEEERKKLWERVTEQDNQLKQLKEELARANARIDDNDKAINNKLSDDVKEAKQASKDTSMYRNRAKDTSEEVKQLLSDLQNNYESLKQCIAECEESKRSITLQLKNIEKKNEDLLNEQQSLQQLSEKMQPLFDTVNQASTILNEITILNKSIKEKQVSAVEQQQSIEGLLNVATKQKAEITKIKNQISGYTQQNKETGESEFINGIQQDLEQTFDKLNLEINNLKKEVTDFQSTKTDEVEKFITDMRNKYDKLIERIEGLLPKALSAGLSHAYYEKKEAEIRERKSAYGTFKWSLFWMCFIAIIPVGLTCYLFFGKHFDIQTIINDTPKIMSAVLALYAPVFWFAYSANKRMNLSKRLIEEYTYKEALSKTFEGLSTQIENINDKDIANDLKSKLLYIIVSMNSENPGKLIKGYNKPDHPVMDIINNSIKLTDSLQNLAQVPVLNMICKPIQKMVEEQQTIRNEKVQKGLDINTLLNNTEESEEDA